MQFHFTTYKLANGWWWQVTQDIGPAIFIVAKSGHPFATEELAIKSYKSWRTWACGSSSATPQSTDQAK